MATPTFDILDYLSGMTNFVFDKSVLNRIALDCGVSEITSYVDLTDEDKDRCKIALLETIIYGVYQTASTSVQHGSYQLSVGAQTITAAMLERLKAELRRLYKKYGEEDKLEDLNALDGEVKWINEYE